jgi:hypothetical protein
MALVSGVPANVSSLVARYLHAVDTHLPGRITGLYLIGSLALGDYRPGVSDVDAVAVSATRLDPVELDAVEAVHGEIALPTLAATYVTRDDLRADPRSLHGTAFHLEGTFAREGAFDANPAVWETLRRYPLCMRGPTRPDVWHDPVALRAWTLQNLDSYWRPLQAQVQQRVVTPPLPSVELLTWCVPGVARLHYTLVTGDITSKSGACRYVLESFPERWRPLATAALAAREGARAEVWNDELARELPHFMDFVVDDAHRLASGDR